MEERLKDKGFTFLELLSVLVIISIFGMIVIPIISNKGREAKITAHNYNVRILKKGANRYSASEKVLVNKNIIDDLVEKNYIKCIPNYPFSEESYVVKIDGDGKIIVLPDDIIDDIGICIFEEKFQNIDNRADNTTADWESGSLLTTNLVEKTFGGDNMDALCNIVDDNDGYICVGGTSSNFNNLSNGNNYENKGEADAIILKYDKEFNPQKLKGLGGSKKECFKKVIKDSNSNYVCVGWSYSDLSGYNGGNENKGERDFLIVKYDNNLNLVNINNSGGSDYDYLENIIEVSDGYICIGWSRGDLSELPGGVNFEYNSSVLIKYDFNLNIVKVIQWNSIGIEYINDIIEDSDGNYVCVGCSYDDLSEYNGGSEDKGSSDFLIAKYDSNLNLIKLNNIGGTQYEGHHKVIQDSDDNYVCVGYSESDLSGYNGGSQNNGSRDNVIVKYDQNLNLIKVNNKGTEKNQGFNDIIQNDKGNYVCVGESWRVDSNWNMIYEGNQCLIVEYDNNLNIIKRLDKINHENLGRIYSFLKIELDNLNNYNIAAGSMNAEEEYEFNFIKYDKDLNFVKCISREKNEYEDELGYIIKNNEVVISSLEIINIDDQKTNFSIGKLTMDGSYDTSNNMLVSKAIDLGESLSDIKIKVDTKLYSNTSYEFEISTDGTNYVKVDNSKLNGKKKISIDSSDKIYYKIILKGSFSKSPKVKSVKFYK